MTDRLSTSDPEFETAFAALVAARRGSAPDVRDVVAGIIADVRARGDAALIELTAKFDQLELSVDTLRISAVEIEAAAKSIDSKTRDALALAAKRIEAYHRRQMPTDDRYTDEAGVELGHRWTALDSVGIYVPGGKASYPSSVLMNAVPAKVAGVPRIAMVVPSPRGQLNPLVLAAAHIAGVDEIYSIGGAQAVAALAYGTTTIPPVDKIVGPGNAYVAEAKRQVFGQVGIDLIAGPSEILVVADGANDPAWTAIDLLSQAEHDETAQSILITDDADFEARVVEAIQAHLGSLSSEAIARASWDQFGATIVVSDLEREAPSLIDRVAPEHLMIATDTPEDLLALVRHAGAVFLGRHTPEAIGDYVSGSNHVLPTARSARFSSGLTLLDFLKRSSITKAGEAGLAAIGPAAATLAKAEGLPAHARSVTIRLKP